MEGMILTNKNQKKIVKAVFEKLNENILKAQVSEVSGTYTPYYDIILDEKAKSKLTEVKMT